MISYISSIASIIAVLATLSTLLLLYFQLREMSFQTKELRKSIDSSTYQSIVDNERSLWEFLSQDDKFVEQFLSGVGLNPKSGLSSKQVISVVLLADLVENIFYQYKRGALPLDLWPSWVAYFKDQVNEPIFNKMWPHMKNGFGKILLNLWIAKLKSNLEKATVVSYTFLFVTDGLIVVAWDFCASQ